MLERVSEEKKALFLIGFTEELIRNSKGAELCKLKEILRQKNLLAQEREKITKESIREEVKLKLKKPQVGKPSELRKEPYEKSILYSKPKKKIAPKKPILQNKRLKIPRQRLPPHLQSVKPVPTSQEIELGKLNVLINDQNVKLIECTGENEKIFVSGKMGKKPTSIILTKEEINEIIDKFSESAKMPKSEGLFKVAFGKLVLTAMVSSTISSTFIIKKIENNVPRPPAYITG